MVFSSPIFLFGFLPITLFFYYISPKQIKNLMLLIFSLLFYAWGEVFYLGIMLASIVSNYLIGIKIHSAKEGLNAKKFLIVGLFINVLLLISFKYANFISDNINVLLSLLNIPVIDLQPVHLPLGISFFTFQAISYIVDVYRKEVSAQKNVFDLALYISLFPQLIAGPIVRYHDVSNQIIDRTHSLELFASGIRRFIYGLAKKMLIANSIGEVADSIFSLSTNELTLPLAWIGIIAYALQIYFDFSGYSDMAIGLGRMFGFKFLENFNYPYVSRSIREFWRRWHISLSGWFRDYVYIPLGGSRVPTIRVYLNLLLVFILTGFWHGASWNFLAWGLFHGLFLASEHAGLSQYLKKLWRPIQHLYLLLVVLVGWVFFRVESLSEAIGFISIMFDFSLLATSVLQYAQVLSYEALYAFVFAFILVTPVFQKFIQYLDNTKDCHLNYKVILAHIIQLLLLTGLLYLSIIKISSSTYNPFIYFRF